MSAPLINFDILLGVVLPALIAAGVLLVLFIVFVLPAITRGQIKRTGDLANATILELRYGRGVVYSGSEYNHNVVSQNIILKLEIHPSMGAPYTAEDRFMAKGADLMKLQPGANIQVRVSPRNPQKVACLPETVTAPANSPVAARAGLAMADLLSRGSSMSPEEVLKAFQEHGIQSRPMTQSDDPKARLEKLKELLNSGLITQQEYEAKKAEIIAKM